MSDFRAIGGVSSTLLRLLTDRMELPTGVTPERFSVTVGPPREMGDEPGAQQPRINLFLYTVGENGELKNQDIPGRADAGSFGRPPLSLDLDYLITPYGTTTEGEFEDERRSHYLLGSAMRVLHDYSIIGDGLVDSDGQPILDESLRGDYEKVKLCLAPVSLDDMSSVWTALGEPYRASAAYRVSVVQIESRQPRRRPLPVGEPDAAGPRVHVMPFSRPHISTVHTIRQDDPEERERPYAVARIGDDLVLRGTNLAAESMTVLLGNVDATAAVTEMQQDAIRVTVPDDEGLQPGPRIVQARVSAEVEGGGRRPAYASNVAVFMLVPRVTELDNSGLPASLTLRGTRLYAEGLACEALMGDAVIDGEEYSTASPDEITVPLPDDLEPGTYPVRVRMNGAESIEKTQVTIT